MKTSIQSFKTTTYLLLLFMLILLTIMPGCSSDTSKNTATDETDASYDDAADAVSDEIYINMDCKDSSLPKRFRKCTDPIDNQIGDSVVDISGLDGLRMSGSGQFSKDGLELVKQEIGDYQIIIVDLREESHGFVNGIALSYMDELNRANQGKTLEQIIDDENTKLDTIKADGFVIFPTDNDIRVEAEEVLTEEEITKNNQMSYYRLPVSNNLRPSDDIVDDFIAFVSSLSADTWLHFHCMEGVGRTTVFMFMHDAMQNAKSVSLDDIMNRQVLLGGKNVLHSGNKDRAEFVRNFYQYCKENDDDFQTSWSDWSKTKGL